MAFSESCSAFLPAPHISSAWYSAVPSSLVFRFQESTFIRSSAICVVSASFSFTSLWFFWSRTRCSSFFSVSIDRMSVCSSSQVAPCHNHGMLFSSNPADPSGSFHSRSPMLLPLPVLWQSFWFPHSFWFPFRFILKYLFSFLTDSVLSF